VADFKLLMIMVMTRAAVRTPEWCRLPIMPRRLLEPNFEVLQAMTMKSEDFSSEDKDGVLPLHYAARCSGAWSSAVHHTAEPSATKL
jgi:hypothetical protein